MVQEKTQMSSTIRCKAADTCRARTANNKPCQKCKMANSNFCYVHREQKTPKPAQKNTRHCKNGLCKVSKCVRCAVGNTSVCRVHRQWNHTTTREETDNEDTEEEFDEQTEDATDDGSDSDTSIVKLEKIWNEIVNFDRIHGDRKYTSVMKCRLCQSEFNDERNNIRGWPGFEYAMHMLNRHNDAHYMSEKYVLELLTVQKKKKKTDDREIPTRASHFSKEN